MICYRDMTFCDYDKCSKFGACHRSLTDEVKANAEKWMKDAPICQFAEKPECFEKVVKNERL